MQLRGMLSDQGDLTDCPLWLTLSKGSPLERPLVARLIIKHTHRHITSRPPWFPRGRDLNRISPAKGRQTGHQLDATRSDYRTRCPKVNRYY
jgi:hypothetical protein